MWERRAALGRPVVPEVKTWKRSSPATSDPRTRGSGSAALARARIRSRAELIVPELLGLLPLDESARRPLRSVLRALGRMPYSLRKSQARRAALAIPVGGSDGARSGNLPPRDRPDESDPEASADRRVGIPYDEWNRFTR